VKLGHSDVYDHFPILAEAVQEAKALFRRGAKSVEVVGFDSGQSYFVIDDDGEEWQIEGRTWKELTPVEQEKVQDHWTQCVMDDSMECKKNCPTVEKFWENHAEQDYPEWANWGGSEKPYKIPIIEVISGMETELELEDEEEIKNFETAKAKGVGDTIYVNDLGDCQIVSMEITPDNIEEIRKEHGGDLFVANLVCEEDGSIRWYLNPQRSDIGLFTRLVKEIKE